MSEKVIFFDRVHTIITNRALKEIAFFPLRRKRGFGIIVMLNLSVAQMWFCEFPQAARPGSQTARKRGFATTS